MRKCTKKRKAKQKKLKIILHIPFSKRRNSKLNFIQSGFLKAQSRHKVEVQDSGAFIIMDNVTCAGFPWSKTEKYVSIYEIQTTVIKPNQMNALYSETRVSLISKITN